jgi:alkane 1-monooxygenase
LGLIYLIFGSRALVFHIIVSCLVTLMFEAVNYLEHYGLQRKLIPGSDSVYESVKITHSWNAPQVVTNYALFKLQRHSDHHANAYKPYQVLESLEESPMLPYGYSVCLLICIFPYIWKKVINPMAIATNKGEKITEEAKQEIERWVLGTLIFTSSVLTYFTFFMVDLKSQP